mgnify:CR=1 FL=1
MADSGFLARKAKRQRLLKVKICVGFKANPTLFRTFEL